MEHDSDHLHFHPFYYIFSPKTSHETTEVQGKITKGGNESKKGQDESTKVQGKTMRTKGRDH